MEDVVVKKTVTTSSSTRLAGINFKRDGFFGKLFKFLAKWLMVCSLIGIDFILFAGAGNNNLFASPAVLTPQALYILIGIAGLSFLLLLLFSFSAILQNLFTALAAGLFFLMAVSHFAQFDKTSFLYGFMDFFGAGTSVFGISHLIVAGIISLAAFVFLMVARKRSLALAALLIIGLGAGTFYVKYTHFAKAEEFAVLKDTNPGSNEPEAPAKKFVYIAVPDLASPAALENMKDSAEDLKINKLSDLTLGFYAKHGFTLYQNAYSVEKDPFIALAKSLNTDEPKAVAELLMASVEKPGYWETEKIADKEVYLKENQLFDKFKNDGYKLFAYESREIDLCNKGGKMNVDRCVEKRNFPANLNKLKLDDAGKTKVLAAQWIGSMGLDKAYGLVYGALKSFLNVSEYPVLGVSYNGLYVVDSPDTLDIAAEDIAKNKENGAYFVFMDMPSDMYLYDEFCRPKSPSAWLNLKAPEWAGSGNRAKVKSSYVDQTACFYGKLEEFMNKVDDANTVVVIQGLNPVVLPGGLKEPNAVVGFKKTSLVNLAVKDAAGEGFKVSEKICQAEDLLNEKLYGVRECVEYHGTAFQGAAAAELKKELGAFRITPEKATAATEAFNTWQEGWDKANTKPLIPEAKTPETSGQEYLSPAAKFTVEKEPEVPAAVEPLVTLEKEPAKEPAVESIEILDVAEDEVKQEPEAVPAPLPAPTLALAPVPVPAEVSAPTPAAPADEVDALGVEKLQKPIAPVEAEEAKPVEVEKPAEPVATDAALTQPVLEGKPDGATATVGTVTTNVKVKETISVVKELEKVDGSVVESVKAEDNIVEAKAPEVKAPETKETKSPEIKAPEAKPVAVKAPEIKAPEAKPAAVKAPEIKLPEAKPVVAETPKEAPKAEAAPAPKAAPKVVIPASKPASPAAEPVAPEKAVQPEQAPQVIEEIVTIDEGIQDKVEVTKTIKKVMIVEENGEVIQHKEEEEVFEDMLDVDEYLQKALAPVEEDKIVEVEEIVIDEPVPEGTLNPEPLIPLERLESGE